MPNSADYGQLEGTTFCCPTVALGASGMRRKLTDRTLVSLKPACDGARYDVMDSDVRGFGVRVNDAGRKTFVLVARYPGSTNPTRRTLGEYPTMTLARARAEATRWHVLLREGIDPRIEAERRELAEARRQENSFASVAEAYFAHIKRQGLRRAAQAESEIRREFVSRWGRRPITDITRHDLLEVIEAALKRGASWQAHHIFSYASRLFNWAIDRGTYSLESSPTHGMRPARVIGVKKPRTRVLSDTELRAIWNVSKALGYPYGPMIQLLLLTGQRKTEVAEARWSEFDFQRKLWVIPPGRMKMDAPHVVPLTADVIAVLQGLPRFKSGEFLFTTTYGKAPVNGFSKAKARLDKLIAKDLPDVPPFVFHDLRRTMRTNLSALPIPDMVRELVIAHARPGLHKVYDQHAYLDEKRHALELWAARLRSIVEPPPANVVTIKARA
jgi:integrase